MDVTPSLPRHYFGASEDGLVPLCEAVAKQGCTLDRFLDGRIAAAQPKRGFRAGHDTVLLAAAVPAGRRVLELGSGTGIASLCYAWRVPDCEVLGIEIDEALVAIANANAMRNGMDGRVRFVAGDVRDVVQASGKFDHVFFNPPFHSAQGTKSPDAARSMAKRDTGSVLANWLKTAIAVVRPQGTVTAILRFDRVSEMLAAADGSSAVLFPLYPRQGAQPKRGIVQVIVGVKGATHACSGLILHHDGGGSTKEAEAILRGAAPLALIPETAHGLAAP
jgi:tRNA1(Val) A37 N6-methylase TrmN6